tara:strand:+ start:269 stop:1486 length:1218 start_codon:yes stop_codon:yes gene_type:complete
MRPLKIKASSYPVSASNFQGLQEMTDTEIEQYYSATLLKDFSDNTNGSGVGEINVTTDGSGTGTTIGSITDTKRQDAIGTHPTAGATTNVNVYTFKQVNSTASESITNRPLGYETSGNVGINEFTDAELDTDILDKVLGDLVAQGNYVTGQYTLASSAPSGGTWTSRYTLVDTQVDETEDTKYIWQKTAATTAAVDNYKPLKLDGTSVKEMSVAEMEQIVPNMRNRITDSTIGTYALQATAPASGTWVQQGDAFSDTRQEVGSQTYEGNYSGNYTGNYTGAKTYTGSYSGSYTGNFSGNYVGTSAYSGAYSGSYSGSYAADYSGYAGTSYSGTYSGSYTGYYTGAKTYTGTYSGAYSGSYSGNYVGTSAYAGTYTGTYTGYYAGDTVLASEETVGTVKLWLKTAA